MSRNKLRDFGDPKRVECGAVRKEGLDSVCNRIKGHANDHLCQFASGWKVFWPQEEEEK